MRETRNNERQSSSRSVRGGQVREVMTPNPECVTENASIQEAAKLMVQCDCGAVPVVASEGSKKVIGMITDRDIVIRIVAKGNLGGSAKVSDAMTRGVHTVRENDSIEDVHRTMSKQQVRRVPVVNDKDEIVGIIALADLATETRLGDQEKKIAHTVEEISETGGEHKRLR